MAILEIYKRCLMWRTPMARVFSSMKHTRFSAAANMAGELRSTSASRIDSLCLWHIFKSVGALGGFVAGSKETLQYLRFYAHPYVYSCALPPVVIAAILKALELGTSQPEFVQSFGKTPITSTLSSESSDWTLEHRRPT